MKTTYVIQYKPEGDGNWYPVLLHNGEEAENLTYTAAKESMEFMQGYVKRNEPIMYKNALGTYSHGKNFEWRIMEKRVTATYEHPRV